MWICIGTERLAEVDVGLHRTVFGWLHQGHCEPGCWLGSRRGPFNDQLSAWHSAPSWGVLGVVQHGHGNQWLAHNAIIDFARGMNGAEGQAGLMHTHMVLCMCTAWTGLARVARSLAKV